MVLAGRRRTIAFFIALGAGLISVILLLYIGWVLLNWRTGILFFLGCRRRATVPRKSPGCAAALRFFSSYSSS
jgi:hypothetical protein